MRRRVDTSITTGTQWFRRRIDLQRSGSTLQRRSLTCAMKVSQGGLDTGIIRTVVLWKDAVHDVPIDRYAECMRDRLGNAPGPESEVTALTSRARIDRSRSGMGRIGTVAGVTWRFEADGDDSPGAIRICKSPRGRSSRRDHRTRCPRPRARWRRAAIR